MNVGGVEVSVEAATVVLVEAAGELDEYGRVVAAAAVELARLIDDPPEKQSVAPIVREWRGLVEVLKVSCDAAREPDEFDPVEAERRRLKAV